MGNERRYGALIQKASIPSTKKKEVNQMADLHCLNPLISQLPRRRCRLHGVDGYFAHAAPSGVLLHWKYESSTHIASSLGTSIMRDSIPLRSMVCFATENASH